MRDFRMICNEPNCPDGEETQNELGETSISGIRMIFKETNDPEELPEFRLELYDKIRHESPKFDYKKSEFQKLILLHSKDYIEEGLPVKRLCNKRENSPLSDDEFDKFFDTLVSMGRPYISHIMSSHKEFRM